MAVGQERCEPLYTTGIDRGLVDLDAALAKRLFDVAVGEVVA
jgi:hypothetical protein